MTINGLIFDIQRFSIHDGPGIRTTVFFKGCSLHCFWCHNPEGISFQTQIQFQANRCIQCGACIEACAEGAHQLESGSHLYNRLLCKTCGSCISACYSDALQVIGKEMTVNEIMAEVMSDRAFYETSGGGVTLSGGEPLLQNDFACELLRACKREALHTAVETAGNIPWPFIEKVMPNIDLFMYDIKVIDPALHHQFTGVRNERIIENARLLAQLGKPIIFRTPIIPSVNDTVEQIQAIAAFIRDIKENAPGAGANQNPITWELLPFHRLASDKYRSLGLDYQASELKSIDNEKLVFLANKAKASNVPILIPGVVAISS